MKTNNKAVAWRYPKWRFPAKTGWYISPFCLLLLTGSKGFTGRPTEYLDVLASAHLPAIVAGPVRNKSKEAGYAATAVTRDQSVPFQKRDGEGLRTGSDSAAPMIHTLELRNYLIRPGQRDRFISYFETNLMQSQNKRGGYILGQYQVKGDADHFFWMRGFQNMTARLDFLQDFYYSSDWKAHRATANSMLLNNDNVYLLQPLALNDSLEKNSGVPARWFGQSKGLTVIDFYISNTKREQLITFIKKQYRSLLHLAAIYPTTFWISESSPNNFPALPTFQDPNLVVQISFYKNEKDYQDKMKVLHAHLNASQVTEMADVITVKNTVLLFPTVHSYTFSAR